MGRGISIAVTSSDFFSAVFLGPQNQYKTGVIERILADFPRRRFLLVGDSGEQDPEIYGAIARKHPEQVERIFIRNVAMIFDAYLRKPHGEGAEKPVFSRTI